MIADETLTCCPPASKKTPMKCPHCGKDISYTVKKFVKARAVKAGMKGGAAGKGSEARRLAAKKAIEARWAKYRAKKAGEQGVRED